jgi:hypothetical protein
LFGREGPVWRKVGLLRHWAVRSFFAFRIPGQRAFSQPTAATGPWLGGTLDFSSLTRASRERTVSAKSFRRPFAPDRHIGLSESRERLR